MEERAQWVRTAFPGVDTFVSNGHVHLETVLGPKFRLRGLIAKHEGYSVETVFFQLYLIDESGCEIADFSTETLAALLGDVAHFDLASLNGSHYWFVHPCQVRLLCSTEDDLKNWIHLFLKRICPITSKSGPRLSR